METCVLEEEPFEPGYFFCELHMSAASHFGPSGESICTQFALVNGCICCGVPVVRVRTVFEIVKEK